MMTKLSDLLNRKFKIDSSADFFNDLPKIPEIEHTIKIYKVLLKHLQVNGLQKKKSLLVHSSSYLLRYFYYLENQKTYYYLQD